MTGRLLRRDQLTSDQRDQMRVLLQAHFSGVDEEQFSCDLEEKNWVILLHNSGGEVLGFSTLLAYGKEILGSTAMVVYSGDTIVERCVRSSSALMRTWISSVHHLAKQQGYESVYWLLITSGFRTYRFLPVCCQEFYPRFDRATPAPMQEIIDCLASDRFGGKYDPHTGIVRLAHPQQLRPGLGDVPAHRLSDPHIAYFSHRNPQHTAGDELVCLADLTASALTAAGQRMIRCGQARLSTEILAR